MAHRQGQRYIGGQRGHAPPFFREVYTTLEIHSVNSSVLVFFSLGYDLYQLKLISSVYPIAL